MGHLFLLSTAQEGLFAVAADVRVPHPVLRSRPRSLLRQEVLAIDGVDRHHRKHSRSVLPDFVPEQDCECRTCGSSLHSSSLSDGTVCDATTSACVCPPSSSLCSETLGNTFGVAPISCYSPTAGAAGAHCHCASKKTVNLGCTTVPARVTFVPGAKAYDGVFNGNASYDSFSAAWTACGQKAACGYIMMAEDQFYLRKGDSAHPQRAGATDADINASHCLKGFRYPTPLFNADEMPRGCALTGAPPTEQCLNNDQAYDSLGEAWTACANVDNCSSIVQHSDSTFYLRRADDPPCAPVLIRFIQAPTDSNAAIQNSVCLPESLAASTAADEPETSDTTKSDTSDNTGSLDADTQAANDVASLDTDEAADQSESNDVDPVDTTPAPPPIDNGMNSQWEDLPGPSPSELS